MRVDELEQARTALLRDTAGRFEDLVDRCLDQRRWWVEQWPEGAQFLTCLLAQDVQENVPEPQWPLCPEHRDHALGVEPDLGTDPFWVCDRSGLPIAPVGRLH
jgi:hypothetical protein